MYFDNFFSSPALLRELREMGTYACGTLRGNRKDFPQEIKPYLNKGLPNRGDFVSKQSGYLSVHLWQDNRPVVIISSNISPTEVTTVERKLKDGTKKLLAAPKQSQSTTSIWVESIEMINSVNTMGYDSKEENVTNMFGGFLWM